MLFRSVGATTVRDVVANQGRAWLRWPVIAGLAFLMGRALWQLLTRRAAGPIPLFPLYLTFGGLASIAGLALVWGLTPGTLRYMLLGLLFPTGVVALTFAVEPSRVVRRVVTVAVLVWAAMSGLDHVALARRYTSGSVPDVYGDEIGRAHV